MNNTPGSTPPKSAGLGKGIFFAVSGYSLWGVFPLYWMLLDAVDPFHLLAARILLSLVLLGAVLSLCKNFVWVTVFKDAKSARMIIAASVILCVNWGVYLWAVDQGRIIEASLGYYITPLISVVLGLVFFKEKLSALQWTAFSLACAGVLLLTVLSGALPWISLSIALCFGFYGLLKKKVKLSSLESLTAETLAALPLGLMLLFVRVETAGGLRLIPDAQGLSYIAFLGAAVLVPLAFCGLVTSLPLYLFGNGARLLPLSTLGFFQFISPTLKFILGIFVFGEFFPIHHFAAFAVIWLAAILHIISLKRQASG
ncbi:MAG: EamA family transporter RarD [Treponema sp.]|nr:EamA family transporter RarD [Treponema sp.]